MLHITEENLGINPNGFREFQMQYVRGSDNASIGQESSREMGAFALTLSVISGQTSFIAANDASRSLPRNKKRLRSKQRREHLPCDCRRDFGSNSILLGCEK